MKTYVSVFYVVFVGVNFILGCKKKENTPLQDQNNNNQNPPPFKEIYVDVRTHFEFATEGHAVCSVNIPLDSFDKKIPYLKTYHKVNLACKSGTRAGIARQKLLDSAYTGEAKNLGAW